MMYLEGMATLVHVNVRSREHTFFKFQKCIPSEPSLVRFRFRPYLL